MLQDFDAEAFEADGADGGVAEEADLAALEVAEDLGTDAYLVLHFALAFMAWGGAGVDGGEAVGGVQVQVNDHAGAVLCDLAHGPIEQATAIARGALE